MRASIPCLTHIYMGATDNRKGGVCKDQICGNPYPNRIAVSYRAEYPGNSCHAAWHDPEREQGRVIGSSLTQTVGLNRRQNPGSQKMNLLYSLVAET